jgi:protein-disulfide isomerase
MANRPRRREKQEVKQQANKSMTRWLFIGLIALAAVVIVVVIIVTNNNNNSKPLTFTARPNANGMSMGDPKAAVKVEDYSDFQCPYCAEFSNKEEQPIVDKYVATGKIQYTFVPFSFIGNESITTAMAAYCAADQNKFWEFKQVLYTNQGAENSGVFSNNNIDRFASQAGLSMADFRSCFSSNKYLQKVQDDVTNGKTRGVQGTPYFFVNGKGPIDKSGLIAAIDDALKTK